MLVVHSDKKLRQQPNFSPGQYQKLWNIMDSITNSNYQTGKKYYTVNKSI